MWEKPIARFDWRPASLSGRRAGPHRGRNRTASAVKRDHSAETSAKGDRSADFGTGPQLRRHSRPASAAMPRAFAIAPYVRREKFRKPAGYTAPHHGAARRDCRMRTPPNGPARRLSAGRHGAFFKPADSRTRLIGLQEEPSRVVRERRRRRLRGAASSYHEDFIIPFAARHVGREVK